MLRSLLPFKARIWLTPLSFKMHRFVIAAFSASYLLII